MCRVGESPHDGRLSVMQRGAQQQRIASSFQRAGLAPVELVLVLPILMMVAALLMIAANAAVWKLRSHGAAREAAFRQVHPRLGEAVTSPPPEWRRPDVSISVQQAPPVWNVDPFAAHTLFRGPVWEGITIHSALLDGSQGMVIGHSQSDIRSGIWTQLGIHYRYQRETYLFAGQQWQYDAMGIGGHGNRRSIPLLDLQ